MNSLVTTFTDSQRERGFNYHVIVYYCKSVTRLSSWQARDIQLLEMVASQNKNLLLALIVNTEQFQNTWTFFFSRTNKKINKNAGSYSGFRLPTFTQYCKTSVYDPEINDMCSAALEWIFVVMLSLTSLIYLNSFVIHFIQK